ncbi:ABC transporter transmembrane domain-containing protein [Laceyella tengchongensis]
MCLTTKFGGYVTDQLRRGIFYKLTRLSPKTYTDFKAGDIAGRIYSCGEIGDLYITQCVIPAIFNALMFIGVLTMMFVLNWQLSLISLILLPTMFFFSNRSAQKARDLASGLQ